jgi:outer membrane protein TolC
VPRLSPLFLLAACTAPATYRQEADEQVYGILERASARVTGEAKTFALERPVDSLRARLASGAEPVRLSLTEALDVAAENSREFQRQKEQLYLAALALTGEQHDFALRFGGGGDAEVSGQGDDEVDVSLRDDLAASMNTQSGGRIVASFVNTFLRSLVHGGGWNASSLLSLTFTQPLLRGAGRRIAREPLTQAERSVIYAVRDFERFRATLAVQVVSNYLAVVQQADNLRNEEANRTRVSRSRQQIEDFQRAGRRSRVEVDRAEQNELAADDRYHTAVARLQSSLDRFKNTLGLPTDALVELDESELERLRELGVQTVELEDEKAIELALARRFDFRNTLDRVADAGRRIWVAEDALRSQLDFSAVINVPTDPDQPLDFDFSRVSWAAGFDLSLALDKLFERNAYRSALISLDAAIRAREQAEDSVKLETREALREIRRARESYEINRKAVVLAERRVESTNDLLQAGGRGQQNPVLDLLDAQSDLLARQLALTGALVDYAVARLVLLRDLEGLVLEPRGLRFDPALPLPAGPRDLPDALPPTGEQK